MLDHKNNQKSKVHFDTSKNFERINNKINLRNNTLYDYTSIYSI